MKILLIQGPNLNLLGTRKPEIYGKLTLDDIHKRLKEIANTQDCEIEFLQSNFEGAIVEIIQNAKGKYDYLIINAAAYTHTSVAIRDAIEAVGLPCIEVHISNIYAREEFRKHSLIAPVCKGQISGFGYLSYDLALRAALEELKGASNV